MKKTRKNLHNSIDFRQLSLAERLAIAIEALGYKKASEFIDLLGVKKSTVYAILNGNTKDPGSRILEKFYHVGINLNWLIAGEGEMLFSSPEQVGATGEKMLPISKPYSQQKISQNLAERIRDTMGDMLGMYESLRQLSGYASELEKLSPEQEKMFHTLVRTFFESAARE